jgi:hypothetical protein
MAHLLRPKVKLQIPPLRSPGFPVELGGIGEHHAAFLRKAAHAALDGVAM